MVHWFINIHEQGEIWHRLQNCNLVLKAWCRCTQRFYTIKFIEQWVRSWVTMTADNFFSFSLLAWYWCMHWDKNSPMAKACCIASWKLCCDAWCSLFTTCKERCDITIRWERCVAYMHTSCKHTVKKLLSSQVYRPFIRVHFYVGLNTGVNINHQ